MPRRRRVRLGAPKIKKKPEKWSGGDPDAPTEKEWNLMETFNIVLGEYVLYYSFRAHSLIRHQSRMMNRWSTPSQSATSEHS